MKNFNAKDIRNFALLSHGGAGKTTLSERILFKTKAISRMGKVEDGTTASDYLEEEIKRKISTNLSLLQTEWKDTKFNILDTPGYSDFISEVKEALRVVENVVLLINGEAGIEVQFPKLWEYTEEAQLSRIIFVNKMDLEEVNYIKIIEDLRAKFGSKILPITIPIGKGANFTGIVDILSEKAFIYHQGNEQKDVSDIPNEMNEVFSKYKNELVETSTESDDVLLEKYLEGKELSHNEIKEAFLKGFKQGEVYPVIFGSAVLNIGIDYLMDFIKEYGLSPLDRGSVAGINKNTNEEVKVEISESSPLAGIVFKTLTDPYVGKISFFRIYSGKLQSNTSIYNADKGVTERIAQLYSIVGKKQEPADFITAGDMGVVTKLVDTATNDSIGVKEYPIIFPKIKFPQTILSRSLKPKTRSDDDKLSSSLARIKEEEPAIVIEKNNETNESVISGLGETHLLVILERLQKKFNVNIDLQIPKVPYRETITLKSKIEGKYKKQTGGHGQYGHCWLEVEPLQRGGGYEFLNKIFGGAIPKQYIPAVEKGVIEAMERGSLAGYPIVDIRVTVVDGSYHPVDSSELAFKIAGSLALKKALEDGKSVLLEPIEELEVIVDEKYMGDVIGDINSKRGKILGMEAIKGKQHIKALVPLAELLNYGIDLGSITQGTGEFKYKHSHYEEMVDRIAEKIIQEAKANIKESE